MERASRNRLNSHNLAAFPGERLFDRIGQAVCRAGCLPAKELFEAWEVARRVRRRFRGGRIVDLACSHGLLAQLLLLLDDSSTEALAVDRCLPRSARTLAATLLETWPRLEGRVNFMETDLMNVPLEPGDVVVSAHACGRLTDLVLERAAQAGARVAVLPCCHALGKGDLGGLEGWLDGSLAMDVTRAALMRERGYRIYTQQIPGDITPKNRLLLAEPLGGAAPGPKGP